MTKAVTRRTKRDGNNTSHVPHVQLVLGDLNQPAILVLRGQGERLVGGHPVVLPYLTQPDPLIRILLQHPQDQLLQLRTVTVLRGGGREMDRIVFNLLVERRNVARNKWHISVDQGVQGDPQGPYIRRLSAVRVLKGGGKF